MPRLTLRPITESDLPFLLEVYMAARADELVQVSWSEIEKRKIGETGVYDLLAWRSVEQTPVQ